MPRTLLYSIIASLALCAGLSQAQTMNSLTEKQQSPAAPCSAEQLPFPLGEPNSAYAQYFIGRSYLATLATGEGKLPVVNVTFEPRCRNDWHVHRGGGQILVCVGGEGWYQAWGEPARKLRPGDVVDIPAGVKHWHGAARDSWFQHIAIGVPAAQGGTDWLEPVSDTAYDGLE